MRRVCFRNPFPSFLSGIPSIQSLQEKLRFLRAQHAWPALHFCIMPIPLLQLQKKTCFMQRRRRFGHGVVVSKICYNTVTVIVLPVRLCKKPVSCREAKGLVTELSSPRFVTYNTVIVSKIWITGYWLCSQLRHVTAANQWPMNNCQDWAFSNNGLEVGLPAFQLPLFAKCDALPKRGLCDMFV